MPEASNPAYHIENLPSNMTAIQFAELIKDQDLFSEIDATTPTGNDVKAEFWADDGVYEYIIEVRRQLRSTE
jgi:hypothetical protein